jgi:hypothetical protein
MAMTRPLAQKFENFACEVLVVLEQECVSGVAVEDDLAVW